LVKHPNAFVASAARVKKKGILLNTLQDHFFSFAKPAVFSFLLKLNEMRKKSRPFALLE